MGFHCRSLLASPLAGEALGVDVGLLSSERKIMTQTQSDWNLTSNSWDSVKKLWGRNLKTA